MRTTAPLIAVLCSFVTSATVAAQEQPTFDRFGGLNALTFEASGFFRTQHDGERWWLVTPEGHAFLSVGVNCIHSQGDTDQSTRDNPYQKNVLAKYGSIEKWIEATRQRCQEWGVNTLGAWSGGELCSQMPYAVQLGMAPSPWGSREKHQAPDFFEPSFAEHAKAAAAGVQQYANDPMLLGYFLDNELPWATDYRFGPNVFTSYVAFPANAPGKQELIRFFQERYQTIDQFRAVWDCPISDWPELAQVTRLQVQEPCQARKDREDFTLRVARYFFKTATEALRAADPNHLILGCRFIWQTVPKAVVQACGEYCDVITINFYESGPVLRPLLWAAPRFIPAMPNDPFHFRAYNALTNKPVMVTEFGFRALDSGLPCTYPPGWFVQPNLKTQEERGRKYEAYVTSWAREPYFVGWHWFQYMDQPKAGRFDGENGNFGIVNVNDDPYRDFVDRFTAANQRAWGLHGAPAR